jgi:hypothetical protein
MSRNAFNQLERDYARDMELADIRRQERRDALAEMTIKVEHLGKATPAQLAERASDEYSVGDL